MPSKNITRNNWAKAGGYPVWFFVLAVALQTKISLSSKFSRNLGSIPKMSNRVLSTSINHTSGSPWKTLERGHLNRLSCFLIAGFSRGWVVMLYCCSMITNPKKSEQVDWKVKLHWFRVVAFKRTLKHSWNYFVDFHFLNAASAYIVKKQVVCLTERKRVYHLNKKVRK